MGYNEECKKAMEEYKKFHAEFEEIISSDVYKIAQQSLIFDFLEAKYRCDYLKLYSTGGKMRFRDSQDAFAFINSIKEIKKNTGKLLEGASIVAKADDVANEVNELVALSPYLPADLMIDFDHKFGMLAKDVLKELPEYGNMVTKKFREDFLISCKEQLSDDSLLRLAQYGVITKNDMDLFKGSSSEKVLNDFFKDAPETINRTCRIRGTSYKNPDGISRQTILKQIHESPNMCILSAKRGKWEDNGVVKPCVEVYREKDLVGYLPQELVDEMESRFKDPSYKVFASKFLRGSDEYLGLEVKVSITGVVKDREKDAGLSGKEE